MGTSGQNSKVALFYNLWDFLDRRGQNIIAGWTRTRSTIDRARVNAKLDMLVRTTFENAIKSKLLHGPVMKQKHIYKLRVHGQTAMRPLLCRGPISNLTEYSLLFGTEERNSKLPQGAAEEAEQNRQAIIADTARRGTHVRIA